MSDFESEFRKFQQMRKELETEIERDSRRQYRQITSLSIAIAITTFVANSSFAVELIRSIDIHVSQFALFLLLSALAFAISLVLFLRYAHKSPLGIGGHCKLEAGLFIDELPNILQILSLLGFLNVLLRQQVIKVTAIFVIVPLLLMYLAKKRNSLLRSGADGKGTQTTPQVNIYLNIILLIVFGWTTYGLASLITFQLGLN